MSNLPDTPRRYGTVTRVLHWGMAVLFLAQFASAAAHWAFERENALRQTLWSYHTDLGVTLFLLVMVRGAWGLYNLRHRPPLHEGRIGMAALGGHIALYALMVIVPFVRLLAAAGSDRGLSYFGLPIFPARSEEITWMQAPSEWHGELGWILALLIVGHIAMAIGWHHFAQRDGTLKRMAG